MRSNRLGVGDVGEVSCGSRVEGYSSGSDDCWGAGRECDTGLECQQWMDQCDPSWKPSWIRLDISHGAWGELWPCYIHRADSGGAHGMRGIGLGVGDVGEMPGGAWSTGYQTSGDDGRGAGRERDTGMVSRRGSSECGAAGKPCRNRVDLADPSWIEHGACELHRHDSPGPIWMRDDRVGVGDIGAVPGGARLEGHASCVDECWGAGWEPHAGMVRRCCWAECDASWEPCRNRIGVGHGAWVEHGAGGVHEQSSGGAHSMRVDRVGVGDIGEVCGGAGSSGDWASGDDGRGARWERLASMVV